MKIMALFLSLLVFGCSYTSSTEKLADGAKETISGIYKSLPKECQSSMTQTAFDGAMKQVESVKAECMAQQEVLKQKIKLRNTLIGALAGLLLCLIAHKVRQFLFR